MGIGARAHFAKALAQLQENVLELGSRARRAVADGLAALTTGDADLARAAIAAPNPGDVPGASPGSIRPSIITNLNSGTATSSTFLADGTYRCFHCLRKSSCVIIMTSSNWIHRKRSAPTAEFCPKPASRRSPPGHGSSTMLDYHVSRLVMLTRQELKHAGYNVQALSWGLSSRGSPLQGAFTS